MLAKPLCSGNGKIVKSAFLHSALRFYRESSWIVDPWPVIPTYKIMGCEKNSSGAKRPNPLILVVASL
jgi:hypothetical protein